MSGAHCNHAALPHAGASYVADPPHNMTMPPSVERAGIDYELVRALYTPKWDVGGQSKRLVWDLAVGVSSSGDVSRRA